ncbi:MAG: DUF2911 domain-containing protein [Calditrichia bacterium]
MKSFINLALCILLLLPVTMLAQINKPSLSPRVTKTTSVGLYTVKLDYGQPGVKDRVIFGGLVPYGKVWRTGANSSTKFSVDAEFTFADNTVPTGDYALYTIPGEKEWTIIIHKNTKLWGSSNYDEADDLVRFTVPTIELKDNVETFTIHFANFHNKGADLVIAWEKTKVIVPVVVDSDPLIFKEIEEKVLKADGEISAQTYFDAAQFYYHKEKNLSLAATWFDKAIELRPEAFWYVYFAAELAYKMEDYKAARAGLEKCLAAAKANPSGDFGYIAKCNLMLEKLEGK